MHPFSVLTLGIFVAGYITARWDLVTRLYELAIFAWDHGVVVGKPERPIRRGLNWCDLDSSDQRLCHTIHIFRPIHPTIWAASVTRIASGIAGFWGAGDEIQLMFSSTPDQRIVASPHVSN